MNAGEIAELLRRSVGEDRAWPQDFGPGTRLDGDLLLEDADMAAFDSALRQRFGGRVDLIGFVADLDIDRIIALSVADVADYVAACCAAGGRSGPA
ncbi:MAG TPA: hypothetical protein VFU73_07210 [Actinocrinis sp.]|nr:hypothetical protein [Actinocrinis sp.]